MAVIDKVTNTLRGALGHLRAFLHAVAQLLRKLGARLVIWRGIFLTISLLLLLGIATVFYWYIHQSDFAAMFRPDGVRLDRFDFVPGDGYFPMALEILYWVSVGVIVKRLRLAGQDARQTDFDLIEYFNEAFSEWLTAPLLAVFALYFLSALRVELTSDLTLSLKDAKIELIIAVSFVLGIWPEVIMSILAQARDMLRRREE